MSPSTEGQATLTPPALAGPAAYGTGTARPGCWQRLRGRHHRVDLDGGGRVHLRRIRTSTASRDRRRAWITNEERRPQPGQTPDILRSAVVITVATLVGHLIPLLPFAWLPRMTALITAIVLSAAVLLGVGVYSSVTLVGDWRKNGLKMVAIGLGAAAVGLLVGRLFHAPLGSNQ